MPERYLLDACAMIAYLNDEEGAQKVEELLWQSNQGSGTLLMHAVNLLEVYYGVYREEGEDLAEETYLRVTNLPIRILEGLKKGVLKEAGICHPAKVEEFKIDHSLGFNLPNFGSLECLK